MLLNLITKNLEQLSWMSLAKQHSVGHIGHIKINSAVGHSNNLYSKVTSRVHQVDGLDRVPHQTMPLHYKKLLLMDH